MGDAIQKKPGGSLHPGAVEMIVQACGFSAVSLRLPLMTNCFVELAGSKNHKITLEKILKRSYSLSVQSLHALAPRNE